jgi:hypothetical protein
MAASECGMNTDAVVSQRYKDSATELRKFSKHFAYSTHRQIGATSHINAMVWLYCIAHLTQWEVGNLTHGDYYLPTGLLKGGRKTAHCMSFPPMHYFVYLLTYKAHVTADVSVYETLVVPDHRLNMELDFQSLFELHVT